MDRPQARRLLAVRIIVLDAARANPYASQGAPLAPGLALVDPEPGELIAFNAAPGTLAGDEQGPYGGRLWQDACRRDAPGRVPPSAASGET